MKAFMGNGYPCSFICSASLVRAPREDDGEREEERPPTAPLPYIAGFSDKIRRVCKDFNIKAMFKYGLTLCSLLKQTSSTKYRLPVEIKDVCR